MSITFIPKGKRDKFEVYFNTPESKNASDLVYARDVLNALNLKVNSSILVNKCLRKAIAELDKLIEFEKTNNARALVDYANS